MKVIVNHSVVVQVQAQGNLEFGQQFLGKINSTVDGIAEKFGASTCNCTPTKKDVRMEFFNVPLESARKLKDEVMRKVTLLAEHGPNVDILNAFLDKHPELCSHPNLSSIVGAFENLNRVLQDVQKDGRNALKAEIQQRAQDGISLVVEDLVAAPRVKTGMTPEERADHRIASILGQTTEQIDAAKRSTKTNTAGLPSVYDKVAAQQRAADPEAVGDAGNIFTTPAKK